jgi:hypothetical protein
MENHLYGSRLLNGNQRRWIESTFESLLPMVKRQILSTIPSTYAENRKEEAPQP